MELKAMIKAVNEGKTVIDNYGNKVFMDLKHEYRPYIYRQYSGSYTRANGIWEHHDSFEILEEPKQEQITDRFELMELCRKWDKEGKRFLVSNTRNHFKLPTCFSYVNVIKEYRWITIDETGYPTGEPQKFMREVKNGD